MRSVPLFVTGTFLDVVGASALVAGTGLVLADPDCVGHPSCGASFLVDLVGIAVMTGGTILLAIGIPLTVVGAAQVPDKKEEKRGSLGPTPGGLVYRF